MIRVEIEVMHGACEATKHGPRRYDVVIPGVPQVGDTVMMGPDGEDQFTVKHVFWDVNEGKVLVRVR